MFKLVAVIFAVVNGAPSEQPSNVFPYSADFESLESCMEFVQTDEGAVLRNAIKEFVQSQRGTITAKLGCTQAEDNTI
jgi:hypothetical protein